jgi:hypothetical protein
MVFIHMYVYFKTDLIRRLKFRVKIFRRFRLPYYIVV